MKIMGEGELLGGNEALLCCMILHKYCNFLTQLLFFCRAPLFLFVRITSMIYDHSQSFSEQFSIFYFSVWTVGVGACPAS